MNNEIYWKWIADLMVESQILKNKEDYEASKLPKEEWVEYKTKQLRSYWFDV